MINEIYYYYASQGTFLFSDNFMTFNIFASLEIVMADAMSFGESLDFVICLEVVVSIKNVEVV